MHKYFKLCSNTGTFWPQKIISHQKKSDQRFSIKFDGESNASSSDRKPKNSFKDTITNNLILLVEEQTFKKYQDTTVFNKLC